MLWHMRCVCVAQCEWVVSAWLPGTLFPRGLQRFSLRLRRHFDSGTGAIRLHLHCPSVFTGTEAFKWCLPACISQDAMIVVPFIFGKKKKKNMREGMKLHWQISGTYPNWIFHWSGEPIYIWIPITQSLLYRLD